MNSRAKKVCSIIKEHRKNVLDRARFSTSTPHQLSEYGNERILRARASAQRNAHKRKLGMMKSKYRPSLGAERSVVQRTLEAMLKRQYPGKKFDNPFIKLASRKMMKNKDYLKKVRKLLRTTRRVERDELQRISRKNYNKRDVDFRGRPGER